MTNHSRVLTLVAVRKLLLLLMCGILLRNIHRVRPRLATIERTRKIDIAGLSNFLGPDDIDGTVSLHCDGWECGKGPWCVGEVEYCRPRRSTVEGTSEMNIGSGGLAVAPSGLVLPDDIDFGGRTRTNAGLPRHPLRGGDDYRR